MKKGPVEKLCGAIDVGGTKISSALFAREAQMLFKNKIPIDKSKADKPAQQIIQIIQSFENYARAEKNEIQTVGICIPGVVYQKSGIVWAPNIPGWDHYPLKEKIQEKVRLPLVLDSDRSAYVLGETWCGAAKGMKDVVFLAVGTGIGAGILIDGKVCRGAEDIAGAVGWFALDPDFKKDYVEMGCFEAEASGNSVARKAIRLLRAGESSMMREMVSGEIEKITAEVVVKAAEKKDIVAIEIIDSVVGYLAMGIANIISILNPEMIVLGGGLFQAGHLLLDPVRREFKKWAQPLAARSVKIELSQLGEDAGLYGAGKLAWEL
jgi:glucokinase